VAVDAVGDLYFTDGNRVYRVDHDTSHPGERRDRHQWALG
jgi:hypothetical protein